MAFSQEFMGPRLSQKLILLFCIAAGTSAWARSVEVRVQDSTGAAIRGATATAQCGDQDFSDIPLANAVQLPDDQVCELVVHANGFADQTVTLAADTREMNVVLSPQPVSETVEVTASRSTLSGTDLPASQIHKTQREIALSPAVTVDDKLRQVPGFSLFRRSGSETSNPTTQGVSLRGLGASGASRSLVLEDGVPINDPFGGWVYWGRVPVESIASVDVVQGGTSDLYGSNALGGVVNIHTRTPLQTSFAGESSFGSSSSPFGSASAAFRFGAWGASFAGEAFDTNGYINIPESARGLVDTPVASQHRTADITIDHSSQSSRLFLRGTMFGESRDNGTVAQFNNTTIRQLAAGADLRHTWGTLSLRAFGGTQTLHQTFSAVAADRNSETLTTDQHVPVQQYGFSAQWSRVVAGRHMLAAGLDGRDITGDTNEVQSSAHAYYIAGGRQQLLGVFFEDVFQASSRWLISGSLREDAWKNVDASARRFPFQGTPTLTYFRDRTDTALSPRFGVTRIVNDHVSIYASAYRSFRAPTLNELYRPFRVGNVATNANPELKAELFTGGEFGTRLRLNRRLQVNGDFFTGYLSNAVGNITLSVTPSLITRQRQNLGRVRVRGFEVQSKAELRKYLTLAMNYQFTDSTVVEFRSDPTLIGNQTPQIPRQALTLQATYSNPRLITLSIQGRTEGRSFDDDQNQFVLDPYFNLGLYISRNLQQHLSVFGAAENVLNSRYAIGKTPLETLAAPISVRVGLRFVYGTASESQ